MTNNIHSMALIEDGVELGKSVSVGPGAVILQQISSKLPPTKICDFAEIGANATIRPGVVVGRSAQICSGIVVTRAVPALAIVDGSPARVVGYRSTPNDQSRGRNDIRAGDSIIPTSVRKVTRHRLTMISDLRGSLVPGEFPTDLPFLPKRFFLVFDVPSLETRGEHAHLVCEQFLIVVKGAVTVLVDDGTHREEFILDRPHDGIYLPAMTWGTQYKYSPDCVLLVFASELYDANDYIRTYEDFLTLSHQAAAAKHFVAPASVSSNQQDLS